MELSWLGPLDHEGRLIYDTYSLFMPSCNAGGLAPHTTPSILGWNLRGGIWDLCIVLHLGMKRLYMGLYLNCATLFSVLLEY